MIYNKGKLEVTGSVETSSDEVFEALLALGYKDKDVKSVIGRIDRVGKKYAKVIKNFTKTIKHKINVFSFYKLASIYKYIFDIWNIKQLS